MGLFDPLYSHMASEPPRQLKFIIILSVKKDHAFFIHSPSPKSIYNTAGNLLKKNLLNLAQQPSLRETLSDSWDVEEEVPNMESEVQLGSEPASTTVGVIWDKEFSFFLWKHLA